MKSNNFFSQERHWEVNCQGETHHVCVKKKTRTQTHTPMEVYLDKRRVDTIEYKGGLFSSPFEYSFACGDEKIMLVIHGNNMDLVYQGKLVNKGIEYHPSQSLPMWYRVVMGVLCLLPISLIYITNFTASNTLAYFLLLLMPTCCAALSVSQTISPFLGKSKKILYSLLFMAWSWVLTVLLILFF